MGPTASREKTKWLQPQFDDNRAHQSKGTRSSRDVELAITCTNNDCYEWSTCHYKPMTGKMGKRKTMCKYLPAVATIKTSKIMHCA